MTPPDTGDGRAGPTLRAFAEAALAVLAAALAFWRDRPPHPGRRPGH